MSGDLFDDLEPLLHRDPRKTEVLAAAVVATRLGGLMRLAFDAIVAAGLRGLTGDELCALHPNITPYSLRPRLTQLGPGKPGRPGLGLIVAKGERANRRGNLETVWVHRRYADD